jgi:dTDP-4-amino-4,6-dideoxygalactose transaminase
LDGDSWKIFESRVQCRRENFLFYKENLGKYEGISFVDEPGQSYFSNRWLTTILIDEEKTGTTHEVIQKELEKENIESRPLWKPMHLQPVFSACPAYLNGVSEKLFKTGLCLPSGTNMTDNDRDRIIHVIVRTLE